ncbi:helix-turn-helix domain-containing protein [Candidatus Methylomirabilis sp.]|uniref:helix-turn-helix domain-containing protein n=1 Tax=Candidatus Methylomirabilis sp. TaxID=2032687 RepID=UPI003C7887A3
MTNGFDEGTRGTQDFFTQLDYDGRIIVDSLPEPTRSLIRTLGHKHDALPASSAGGRSIGRHATARRAERNVLTLPRSDLLGVSLHKAKSERLERVAPGIAAEIARSNMSMIERGKTVPSFGAVVKLASALGCSLAVLASEFEKSYKSPPGSGGTAPVSPSSLTKPTKPKQSPKQPGQSQP